MLTRLSSIYLVMFASAASAAPIYRITGGVHEHIISVGDGPVLPLIASDNAEWTPTGVNVANGGGASLLYNFQFTESVLPALLIMTAENPSGVRLAMSFDNAAWHSVPFNRFDWGLHNVHNLPQALKQEIFLRIDWNSATRVLSTNTLPGLPFQLVVSAATPRSLVAEPSAFLLGGLSLSSLLRWNRKSRCFDCCL